MFGLASHRIIDNQLSVSDPFQFFYYLKNHSTQESYDNLTKLMIISDTNHLYDLLFYYASNEYVDYTDLINNKSEYDTKNYLTDLLSCMKHLNHGGYIRSHYREKYDINGRVTSLRIMLLDILEKGEKIKAQRAYIKAINFPAVLKEIVGACQVYVEETDIMKKNREDLIKDFTDVVKGCCEVPILVFHKEEKRDLQINRYEGCIEISDVDALKSYISNKNSFEIEAITKEMILDSILSVSEIKIVMNALSTHSLEKALEYMDENSMLDYIGYLTNQNYIKLDMSYSAPSLFSTPSDFIVNNVEITKKGKSYLKSDKLNYLKGSRHMVHEMSEALKEFHGQTNHDKYLRENVYLKNFIKLH